MLVDELRRFFPNAEQASIAICHLFVSRFTGIMDTLSRADYECAAAKTSSQLRLHYEVTVCRISGIQSSSCLQGGSNYLSYRGAENSRHNKFVVVAWKVFSQYIKNGAVKKRLQEGIDV